MGWLLLLLLIFGLFWGLFRLSRSAKHRIWGVDIIYGVAAAVIFLSCGSDMGRGEVVLAYISVLIFWVVKIFINIFLHSREYRLWATYGSSQILALFLSIHGGYLVAILNIFLFAGYLFAVKNLNRK